MGLKELLLSNIIAKDRKTLEKWLVLLELEAIVGGLVLVAVLLLMVSSQDFGMVVKMATFALILFIGMSTIALFQVLLLVEWNTRKR